MFECNLRTRTADVIFRYSEAGPLAYHVSTVPHLSGFALLFRIGDVLLMDMRNPRAICSIHKMNLDLASAVEEPTSFEDPCRGLFVDDEGMSNVACALLELRDSGDDDPMNIDNDIGKSISSNHVVSWSWEPVGSTSSKLVFCLDTGELHILEICSEVGGIRVNLSDCAFKGSPCKTLLWVDGGFIVGLVDMGDGMVLKLEHGRIVYKSSVQNIAPILDLSIENCPEEKQDQIFACCGMNPEGSIRTIRNGISVEKLLRTAPIYPGITGTWALKMKKSDTYHSFLVLSFVEETRVLSVGLSFNDVTDAAGFLPDVCSLACGLVADGMLVQVHKAGVRLCLPTTCGHPGGVPLSTPIFISWYPQDLTISMGAVGNNFIVVSTSNPCFLFILGVKPTSACQYEIYVVHQARLQHEVSCISIPPESVNHGHLSSAYINHQGFLQNKSGIGFTFVIGTHKPSVEVLLFVFKEGLRLLAVGSISISSALGSPISGCIPETVRLVSVDRPYILAGLRNGMLLRYEWPATSPIPLSKASKCNQSGTSCFFKMDASSSSPSASYSFADAMKIVEDTRAVFLQLIAVRRIGITPVVLVALNDAPDADIIILSDRPWLLFSARHSLAYTSISFQPATHVTPVSSADCPKGIIFVAENSLHLVRIPCVKSIYALSSWKHVFFFFRSIFGSASIFIKPTKSAGFTVNQQTLFTTCSC